MVYIVDRSARVVAMSTKTGNVAWISQLTAGTKLAWGQYWLEIACGWPPAREAMAGLNPKTGKIVSKRDLGYRLNIAPIVASGHMYILTDNAKLVALN